MSKLIHYSGPAGSILLPQGYTRLAYIESTGTLWVDTGWKPTSNMVAYIEYSHTESTIDTPLYGVRDSDMSNSYTCWSHPEEYFYGCIIDNIHGGTDTLVTTTFHIGDKITLLSNKTSVKVNGVSKTRTAGGSTQVNNLVLMGLRNGTNIDSRKFVGKIYFARFWDGDTLVRDFVPVKKSDGTIGLLDLVNNIFYGNSGTGTFIAGPECPQGFPTSEYCLVEWLESTGGLKLLITGLTAAANDLFGINVMVANTTENKDKSFTVKSGNNLFLTVGHSYNATNKTIINSSSVGGVTARGGWIIPYGSFILAELSTTICGTDTLNRPLTGNVTSLTIMEYSSCRIAYFKVSHKNTVIHHLIPCYRRSDMKPGMYDLVGRLFYTNSGTGEFLLGPSITFGWGEVVNGARKNLYPNSTTRTIRVGSLHLLNRISNLGFNGIRGPWTISFDAVSTANVTVYLDICDLGHKNILITTTKLHFSITATATNYYTSTNYNGFWDMETNGPNGAIITITNIMMLRSSVDTGYVPNVNLNAIPHNISTGDGRNGEKNSAFDRGYIKTQGLESLKTSNWTIACWLYPLATCPPNGSAFLGLGSTINGALIVESYRYFSYNTSGYPRISNLSLENNKWTHIAFVNNGNTIKYYKNGIYVNKIDSTNIVDTGELWVGSRCFGGEVNCRFLDIQVWNEIKNPAELM